MALRNQRIAIFGATGSIGQSALDVIRRHPEQLHIAVLAAGSNVTALADLCAEFRPKHAIIADVECLDALRDALHDRGLSDIEAHAGDQAHCDLAESSEVDTVVAAIVGAAGLASTLAAARAGKRILLANKESLVVAGELLMHAAHDGGATIIPVDSEHNAIFQCLPSEVDAKQLQRIILTASGGPFRGRPRDALKDITPAQAVKHPKWSMGPKISVDSATLMNKGLEVIEAHHLFAMSPDQIDVLVHPQSLVHSFVEFVDGSTMAQLGLPDMRTALAIGFSWPDRVTSGVGGLDLVKEGGKLEFEHPDLQAFPCLALAFESLRKGQTAPAILNAANEVAVDAFLNGNLSFLGISDVVEQTLLKMEVSPVESIAHLMDVDRESRNVAVNLLPH